MIWSVRSHLFYSRLVALFFYLLVFLTSTLSLVLLLYWALRLDSNLYSFFTNVKNQPVYLWSYVALTAAAVVLFGVNVCLLVYRWRHYGRPQAKTQAGIGPAALVAVLASACPVCGSTLLSLLGLAGGLAVLPLAGLELKALSVALMLLPVWLTLKDLRRNAACEIVKGIGLGHTSGRGKETVGLALLLAVLFGLVALGWGMVKNDPAVSALLKGRRANSLAPTAGANFDLYREVFAQVTPPGGYNSRLLLKDVVLKLVQRGVIDRQKFEALYRERGGLPPEFQEVFVKPLAEPILLTHQNANNYLNFFWPLGLANYLSTNKKSPVLGPSLFNFASTGGWNLGRQENGGQYFNKFPLVKLISEQEELVTKIAQETFRPCCNNSTFFQDCNHGSALLGLLELGASQSLTEDELYREALVFNSFWFPENYLQTALYFKVRKGIDWAKVDPRAILGFDYSSLSGWSQNVQAELAKIPGLIPQTGGGAGCGL